MVDSMHERSGQAVKTTLHAFWGCDVARKVWDYRTDRPQGQPMQQPSFLLLAWDVAEQSNKNDSELYAKYVMHSKV